MKHPTQIITSLLATTLLLAQLPTQLPTQLAQGQENQQAPSKAPQNSASNDIGTGLGNFEVHSQLDVSVFATEPLLVNPSNIDIDHLGRVWVCEIINYRNKIRNADFQKRTAGDRILILEDTDHDGAADTKTVFFQGTDVDSAHGICVLGDRALVSAGSEVFYLIDTDGDSKADKKEILFTGIGGVQHDHGIHAFVFGPDGKLYFNFGNHGGQICDAEGNPIVDLAGNQVNDKRAPYQQGMIFRCNTDGSEFETLAWNFRNNWEMCVNSFGAIWQSDNDDDGNRSTRINYVMPFGNYGYRDELTGAGWRQQRAGQSELITKRHWHQNDPGSIPNLLDTGAGSPTGICIYEGQLLPEIFRGQLIHCDAGPNVVRSYPVTKQGSGFDARSVDVMDGSKQNQWFRPSDVCVAPDGSLIVADWCDPGVGGHRMGDIQRGRLFRITPKSHRGYAFSKPDFETVPGAVAALTSPNLATRYIAYQRLLKFAEAATEPLADLAANGTPHHRARAYWVLDAIYKANGSDKIAMIDAWNSSDTDLQMMALRWSRQETDQARSDRLWEQIDIDAVQSRAALRELAICLSNSQRRKTSGDNDNSELWMKLANKYQPGERWFLEALGIGAAGNWDACVDALTVMADWQSDPATVELIWRSRGKKTLPLLISLLKNDQLPGQQIRKLFRAIDFNQTEDMSRLLNELVLGLFESKSLSPVVAYEAMKRTDVTNWPPAMKENIADQASGTGEFIEVVSKLNLQNRFEQLLPFVVGNAGEDGTDHYSIQQAIDSIKIVVAGGRLDLLKRWLNQSQGQSFERLTSAIGNARAQRAAPLLIAYAKDSGKPLENRKRAIRSMSKIKNGCKLIVDWTRSDRYDRELQPAIKATLHAATWPDIQQFARTQFPIKASRGDQPVPAISNLIALRGTATRGKQVFERDGTCAKCHTVGGVVGSSVDKPGPDLTKIGSKLSRPAMFESILFPSAGINHNFETWLVLKTDGTSISGIKISQTDAEFQIRDAENVLHKIPTADIDEAKQLSLSLMPNDLYQALTQQQLVDLVEYLISLK